MENLKICEIMEAMGGSLLCGDGETSVSGISTDSRTARKGEIFFALKGENFDAHNFLPQVFASGCDAAVVSWSLPEIKALFAGNVAVSAEKGENAGNGAVSAKDLERMNIIQVADPERALQDLAHWYIGRFKAKKIAVTGSTGKTTTRDMIYYICSEKYKTLRNEKNFNNGIGLPLTILKMTGDIEVAVLEMGMDRMGEIDMLSAIARPDIAAITNVRTAHMELLGGRENIFKAKMEIVNHFGPENVLVINGDGDLLTKESAAGDYKLVTTGSKAGSDYVVSDLEDFGEDGISFVIEHEGESQKFRLSVPGRHNAENAAVAVAAAAEVGISMSEAACGLAKMELTEKRLEVKEKNGIKLIDDTYNATPDAMKAGLDVLAATKGKRKVAILADMGQLADEAEKYHRYIGKHAANSGVELVISIGDNSRYISDEAAKNGATGVHFEDRESFYARGKKLLKAGDVVYIKGSHFTGMEYVVAELLK